MQEKVFNLMSKRTISCVLVLILVGVGLLFLVSLAAVAWFYLPERATASFGPQSDRLSGFQRVYLSLRLLQQSDDLLQPKQPNGEQELFVVDFGEPTFSITNRLQSEGLIVDAGALRDYLVYSGLDTSMQAGEFMLSPGMSAVEITKAMQDPTPTHIRFSILPGWRLEEIAAALPTSGLTFSGDTFLSAATNPTVNHPLLQQISADNSLEGFLFPGSYRLARDLSVDQFLTTLLDEFSSQISPDLLEGLERQGLSLYQAVTLAAIVQREALVEDEMPLIASVYLNRLAMGMNLDADPTVQYAIGLDENTGSWWKSPLSLDDLQVSSPYNTYQINGLPPGPIASPGLKALQAVARPAQTPYYYFRAACDGSGRHTFARTLEEQINNACP